MYYSFNRGLAYVNDKLNAFGLPSLSESEARDCGIVDDMTVYGLDDIIREIRDQSHVDRCENKVLRDRGDLDHLSDYDS